MKKNKITLFMISILTMFFCTTVFAAAVISREFVEQNAPKACPPVANVINNLDISSVSKVTDHLFTIKKIMSLTNKNTTTNIDTHYTWNFSVENILANSDEEALTIIKNTLHTLQSSSIKQEYYETNHSMRSDCFFIRDTYVLHHLVQCSGFWTQNCEEQFQ